MKLHGLLISALSLSLLAGCSTTVDEYADRRPLLDPRQFFDGKLCADGVVKDWSGEQMRQFNARIIGSWAEDGTGTLEEVFHFEDAVEHRTWTLKPDGEGRYLADAGDVLGPVVMRHAGNSIHMQYTLRYGEPGDTIDLNMDDWMYQVADGVVINETAMSKWGLGVGELILVIRKVGDEERCLPAP